MCRLAKEKHDQTAVQNGKWCSGSRANQWSAASSVAVASLEQHGRSSGAVETNRIGTGHHDPEAPPLLSLPHTRSSAGDNGDSQISVCGEIEEEKERRRK